MTAYPELDELTDLMSTRPVHIDTSDITISPGTTVPDTILRADIAGMERQRDPGLPAYTHAIHRYSVIGGETITWVGPGILGSTTCGPFGESPAGDDVIEQTWAEILSKLAIDADPHAR